MFAFCKKRNRTPSQTYEAEATELKSLENVAQGLWMEVPHSLVCNSSSCHVHLFCFEKIEFVRNRQQWWPDKGGQGSQPPPSKDL